MLALVKDDMCRELGVREREGLVGKDDVAALGFKASDVRCAGAAIII
jgi:hypothetical protein